MNINKYDVAVIDYNTGNIDSVIKAIKYFNKSVILTNNQKDIDNSKRIILPGQGSFQFGMQQLEKLNLIDLIKKKALIDKIPTLGICLGMQLFADLGYEKEKTAGLGFIKGEIKKISTSLKLPHIGWNEVSFEQKNDLFDDLENDKDFYFVHSYYFDCSKSKNILAKTSYDFKFPSIIRDNNIVGFQFHPEKSLKNGFKLLNNFLKI
jgi:glutamine amidotransferase